MKWYEKFKVGQKVKVVRKVDVWSFNERGGASWVSGMDNTIGKLYEIVQINKDVGYQLLTDETAGDTFYYYPMNYWYPLESLGHIKGEQLLFSFMG